MGLSAVFNIVTGFAMLLFFIRFMAEFAGLEARNPYVEPAFKATVLVDIFERILKPLGDGRICTAAIVLMFMIRSIDIAGNLVMANLGYSPLQLLYVALNSLVLDFLKMARWLIIGSAVASLFVMLTEKMHPLIDVLMRLAEPISMPFRRISPNLGMLDISPMIALLAIILLEIFISTMASHMLPMIIPDRSTLIFTAQVLGLI